jgi:putative transposase
MMYRWRKLTDDDRREVLEFRRQRGHPEHSPYHHDSGDRAYHITAACFEHSPHIGISMERMNAFAGDWLDVLHASSEKVIAWALLPNHYHALVHTGRVLALLQELGRLHGRTSHAWNGEENTRGRQVWCKAAETVIKSEGHYFATVNYIHHNPVKHRYVEKWTDWPWSSAAEWVARSGRAAAEDQWRKYPIKDYGNGWDDPEM